MLVDFKNFINNICIIFFNNVLFVVGSMQMYYLYLNKC